MKLADVKLAAAVDISADVRIADVAANRSSVSSVPIYYQGSASSGSFYTALAHGQVSAQIVCTSGPIPPPSTGSGSDVSSAGPVMPPTYDPPPPP